MIVQLGILFRYCSLPGVVFYLLAMPANASVICVTPLNNNTGSKEYDELVSAAGDMIEVMLAEQKAVTVVERRLLEKVLREQKLSMAGLIDAATAIRVGQLLKADRILVGGVIKDKEDLVVSVQVYDISSSRLIAGVTSRKDRDHATDLLRTLCQTLAEKMNDDLMSLQKEQTDKTPQASHYFTKGMGMYFAGNYDKAAVYFMKAQEAKPADPWILRYWLTKSFFKNEQYSHTIIELKSLIKDTKDVTRKKELQTMLNESQKHQFPWRIIGIPDRCSYWLCSKCRQEVAKTPTSSPANQPAAGK